MLQSREGIPGPERIQAVGNPEWQTSALMPSIETKKRFSTPGSLADRAAQTSRVGPYSPSASYLKRQGRAILCSPASRRAPGHARMFPPWRKTAQFCLFNELAAVADYSQSVLWPEVALSRKDAPSPAKEHQLIIGREKRTRERRSLLRTVWHLGGSPNRHRQSQGRRTLTGPTKPSLTIGRKPAVLR